MQSSSATLEAPSRQVSFGLPARLAILGALLLIELLGISVWLDAQMLQGRGALAGLVYAWGAWSVRLGVAIVLGSLIFAESRARNELKRISADCASEGFGWGFLAAHAATMAAFVWLSSMLFQQNASGQLPNSLVLAWAVVGTASLALAACALVPVRIWIELFRNTRDALIFGAAAAIAACALGIFAQNFWQPLSRWTLAIVAAMLHPIVPGLVVDQSARSIGTQAFSVEIAQQCSGYEGVGLILAFSAAWLWFFRRQWRFPQALLLVPAGVVVMWFANSARIAALLMIGIHGAPQIAAGGFHSQAGWITFNAVAIGICLGAQRIPALNRQPEVKEAARSSNPTAAYLMPFLAILAAAMISRSLSAGFEWFYGLRVLAAAWALGYFWPSYRGADTKFDWKFGWTGVIAGALVFVLWMVFVPHSSATGAPQVFAEAAATQRFAWLAVRLLGGIVTVPIAEELAFRGFLFRRLQSSDFESAGWRTFSWTAFLISSIAFGLMHGDQWIAGTLTGAIFALAQLRRGRIGDAIAAHAVANGLIAVMVLARGYWQLW